MFLSGNIMPLFANFSRGIVPYPPICPPLNRLGRGVGGEGLSLPPITDRKVRHSQSEQRMRHLDIVAE